MKRYHFIALVLISTMPVSWAQFPQISIPARKGVIESAWVDPANPTTATPVTLHVTTADHLDLDRIETRKSSTMFTVKVYWKDRPGGGGGPGQGEESLGALAKGSYTASIQSYYGGRLVGTKRVSFRVAEGPSNGQSKCIDKIWIEPEEPVASEPATLHVSGEWPTEGYTLDARARSTSGNNVTVKMYWTRPTGPVAQAQVVTAYEEQVDLNTLREGTCTLKVECYLNRIRVDWAEMSFEVKPGEDTTPDSFPWPFPLPWPWPW